MFNIKLYRDIVDSIHASGFRVLDVDYFQIVFGNDASPCGIISIRFLSDIMTLDELLHMTAGKIIEINAIIGNHIVTINLGD